MTNTQNISVKYGGLLPEMFIFGAFLDRLGPLYNAWKDIYFSSYSKTMKNEYEKML